jgi:hypothetical protein
VNVDGTDIDAFEYGFHSKLRKSELRGVMSESFSIVPPQLPSVSAIAATGKAMPHIRFRPKRCICEKIPLDPTGGDQA